METTHKGFEIKYDESKNEWYFYDQSGTKFAKPSLKSIKGFIGRMKRKAFKQVQVYVKKYYGEGFVKAILMSISEKGKYRIKYSNGDQENEWHAPILATATNTKKIEKINSLYKEKNKIEKQIEKIISSAEHYKKA